MSTYRTTPTRHHAFRVLSIALAAIFILSLPAAANEEENQAKYAEYGGDVAYGEVLEDGSRTASQAILTQSVILAAQNRDIGSTANRNIIPPGFYDLGDNRSRGHVIGRQLGGSGRVEANLVALYQNSANSPVMSNCESKIAAYLEDGLATNNDLYYRVEPIYDLEQQQYPIAVWIYASDNSQVLVNLAIFNTPEAPVINGSDNMLC